MADIVPPPSPAAQSPRIIYAGPMPNRPRDYYALAEPGWGRGFVYVLIDHDGQVLYVGRSWRPGNRFDKHKSKKQWWPEVDRVAIFEVHGSTPNEAHQLTAELELRAIRYYKPMHNIAGAVRVA